MLVFRLGLFVLLGFIQLREINSLSLETFKEFQPSIHGNVKRFFKTIQSNRKDIQIRKMNWFFDNQFKYVKYYGFYTIPLPNITTQFKHQVEDDFYTGDLKMTNGLLVGLDLKRICNVTLSYNYPIATIQVFVGYNNLQYLYHYKANFMSVKTVGGVIGEVERVTYMLVLNLDVVDLNLSLQRYSFETFGNIIHAVQGEETLSKTKLFNNVTKPIICDYIKPILTKYTKDVVTSLISLYNQVV